MSDDPFAIDGPAVVSFSGGRTSGLMLRRILDAGLRPDVHVIFADTGKERPETYDFVRECAARWGVPITWVRRAGGFDALLAERPDLPGPMARYCTVALKIDTMREWMKAHGYAEWANVVGIRADEPRRVARLRGRHEKEWDYLLPLAEAGITEPDVLAYWRAQPFDLQLRTWEGNCDLCFMKGVAKRERIMRDRPDLAGWWIEAERRAGTTFRRDGVTSYAGLMRRAQRQPLLPLLADDPTDIGECLCTD